MRFEGSTWVCTDEDMKDHFGKICTVIGGELNPDWNGDNDVKVQFEDGSISYVKLRRFMVQFDQIETKSIKDLSSILLDKLAKVEAAKVQVENEIRRLQDECDHDNITEKYGSGYCPDCGFKTRGWLCKTSPTKECEYYDPKTNEYDEDCCIHCGHPEERK